MKSPIVITQTHWNTAAQTSPRHFSFAEIANKAMALAERDLDTELRENIDHAQEQYITAEEARKLVKSGGRAEYFAPEAGYWITCDFLENFSVAFEDGEVIKYRAIKQPEPAEPHAELKALYVQQFQRKTLDCYLWEFLNENGDYQHCFSAHDGVASEPLWLPHKTYRCTPKPTCQIKNLDTGKTETMTREKAKLLQAELGDAVEWFTPRNLMGATNNALRFIQDGIYSYKRKANLVKLDGKFMSREAAIAEWESKKDTCDVYSISTEHGYETLEDRPKFGFLVADNFEYRLREKQKKQLDTAIREGVIALLQELGLAK